MLLLITVPTRDLQKLRGISMYSLFHKVTVITRLDGVIVFDTSLNEKKNKKK